MILSELGPRIPAYMPDEVPQAIDGYELFPVLTGYGEAMVTLRVHSWPGGAESSILLFMNPDNGALIRCVVKCSNKQNVRIPLWAVSGMVVDLAQTIVLERGGSLK